MQKPLRLMKFGGTSVGDASCIARVAQIVREVACESSVVVVVSGMSGVTNHLIEAATRAEANDRAYVAHVFENLRQQHEQALAVLIRSDAKRHIVSESIEETFSNAQRLCEGTSLLRELTPRTLDAISSVAERLSTPIVAGALAELEVRGKAVDATELIVTDDCHGAAQPMMQETRERARSRLMPLLEQGIVPVVTGFIGATQHGVLTTLGRGGSDYSATILGAALEADEVIIWTDVDGVLTADPRLVPDARTIPEISYREAAELAYFGAKVLHPKTLRPVAPKGIPVWIRNSFEPQRSGTKITAHGRSNGGGVKALTAINDVALIAVGGPGIVGLPDVVGRTFSTTADVRTNVLLISQSSSQNDICFIVAAADAKKTVDALRKEFAQDVAHEKVEHITMDPNIAIVAVVGENMRGIPGVAGRTFDALGRAGVNVIAIAQGSSESNISFVVEEVHMKAALLAVHREFALAGPAQVSDSRAKLTDDTASVLTELRQHAVQQCISASCGAAYALTDRIYACPRCQAPLEIRIHFDSAPDAPRLREIWRSRASSLVGVDRSGVWRFREVLPFDDSAPVVTLLEGNTPLYDAPHCAEYSGLQALQLKHQGCSPTGSFKDTGMTVAVTHAQMLGARIAVCASTGNTAASLAAYSARAGLRCAILVPRGQITAAKLAQSMDYGAAICEIDGNFDDCMRLIRELGENSEIYVANSINPFRIEGQKTVAFELMEQCGWQAPHHLVVPGGNLGNSSALGKGFSEMLKLHLIDRIPRLHVIQAEGAAPFARMFGDMHKSGSAAAESVLPETMVPELRPQSLATAIKIGAPVSWKKSLRAVLESHGRVIAVAEEEIADAKAMIGRDGIGCEPASATTVAGIRKLVRAGQIQRGDRVVAVLTGHVLKDPDYVSNYHRGTLSLPADREREAELQIQSEFQNRPERVAANKSAILEVLERRS